MFNEGALLGTKKKNNSNYYLTILTFFTEFQLSLYSMEAHSAAKETVIATFYLNSYFFSSQLWDYISHFTFFFSELRDLNSQFWLFSQNCMIVNLQVWVIKSVLYDTNSQLQEKN